jgi:hypothetical protein
MLRFQGSLDDLQDTVTRCAIPGEWSFHKKNRFYRFHAETGAILNWWPTTGTINFQGHAAQQFESLFLKHAFVEAAQSGPALVCEESAWDAMPGSTPPLDRSREAPSFAGETSTGGSPLHPRRTSFPGQPSFSPLLVAAEGLGVAELRESLQYLGATDATRGVGGSPAARPTEPSTLAGAPCPVRRHGGSPCSPSSAHDLIRSMPTPSAQKGEEGRRPPSLHCVPRLR